MSFGTRYQQTFTAKNGFTYRVNLKEKSYASSTSGFTFSGPDHTQVEWYGGGEDFAEFVPAEATIRLIDPSLSIASNIFAAGDEGYQAVIEENQGAGYSDYLYTYVDPGQVERPRDATNAPTSVLRAVDGLGNLQDKTFESAYGNDDGDDTGISGTESLISIITRILDQIGFQIPVYVGCDWKYFKSSGSQLTSSDQVLQNVLLDIEKYAPEGEGESVFCDHVLREILKNFDLRIVQARGAWHLYQHELYDNDKVPFTRFQYVYNYYSAGTAPTTDSFNPTLSITSADLLRRSGGRGVKRRPLKTAKVVYDHGTLSELIVGNIAESFDGVYTAGVAQGWSRIGAGNVTMSESSDSTGRAAQFIGSVANTQSSPTNATTAFDNHATDAIQHTGISVPGGSDNKIKFTIDLFSNSGSTTGRHRHVFVEFKVGSQWLTKSGSWSASQEIMKFLPRAQAWSTIGAAATEEIPASGSVFIRVWNPVEAHSYAVESGAGIVLDKLRVEYLPGGDTEDEETISVSVSSATTATQQDTVIETELGDGPIGSSRSSFKETATVPTSNWGRGVQSSASGVSIHKLLGDSRIRLRFAERDVNLAEYRFESDTVAPIEAIDSPVIDGVRYGGPIRLLRDLHQATSDIEAVEVELNGTATTQSELAPVQLPPRTGQAAEGSYFELVATYMMEAQAVGLVGNDTEGRVTSIPLSKSLKGPIFDNEELVIPTINEDGEVVEYSVVTSDEVLSGADSIPIDEAYVDIKAGDFITDPGSKRQAFQRITGQEVTTGVDAIRDATDLGLIGSTLSKDAEITSVPMDGAGLLSDLRDNQKILLYNRKGDSDELTVNGAHSSGASSITVDAHTLSATYAGNTTGAPGYIKGRLKEPEREATSRISQTADQVDINVSNISSNSSNIASVTATANANSAQVVLKAESTSGKITKLALVQLDSSVTGGSAITLAADQINIDGTTTFSSGYDPSEKAKVYEQATAPSSPSEGDLWRDTSTDAILKRYNGTSWVVATTTIDGAYIKTGAIESNNYSAGSAGWQIDTAGDAEFNNVTVRGTIGASTIDGTITGGSGFRSFELSGVAFEHDVDGLSANWSKMTHDGDNGVVVSNQGSGTTQIQGSAFKHSGSTFNLTGIPTSSSGLPSGGVWNDSGTLKIV